MAMKTLVLGASTNPTRFSYKAVKSLLRHNTEVVAVGRRAGEIEGIEIHNTPRPFNDIHTILIYLNTENQKAYYKYMLGLNPKRIIFNPGAENPEFAAMAEKSKIEVVNDCSVVMINTDKY